MKLTSSAISQNRVTLAILFVLLFGGLLAYLNSPRSEDPGFTNRMAIIATYLPGASPLRMEELVTDKIEQKVQEIPEVKSIRSESRTGRSIIYVEVKDEFFDIQPIWDHVRRNVNKATRDLPDGVIGPIVNDEFGDVYGTSIALTGEGYSFKELEETAKDIRDRLLTLGEVGKVDILGVQPETIYLEFSNAKLAKIGLSALQLQQLLQSQNILTPGGSIRLEQEEIVLQPSGNFDSVDELANTIIPIPNTTQQIRLQDVVDIRRAYKDPASNLVYFKGEPSLLLGISMRDGGNILTLGEEVNTEIEALQQRMPIGLELHLFNNMPQDVDTLIDDFVMNLIQSIIIVILVMLVSLGFRTGILVSTLIPSVILTTFLIMSFFDIGIDIVSLGAILVALGILVDNAIVISESILVMVGEGKSIREAANIAAQELWRPLLTASLTTSAAFLPIFLAENKTGEFTAPLFQVVAICLLTSWVLALTIIPLFCVWFLKVKPKDTQTVNDDIYHKGFYKHYRKGLLFALHHKFFTMLGIVGIFFVAVYFAKYVPQKFFPPSDLPILRAEIELPAGSKIENTEDVAQAMSRFLSDSLQVKNEAEAQGAESWTSFVGFGGPRFKLTYMPEPSRPNYGITVIKFTDLEVLHRSIPMLSNFVTMNFPDVTATFKLLSKGPPSKKPVEIRISGKDIDKLYQIADSVSTKLATIPGTQTIDNNWGIMVKKFDVQIDKARALRAGVTNIDVAISLQTALSGLTTGSYREGTDIIPVTLRSNENYRNDISKLEGLMVVSQRNGNTVPLSQVAEIKLDYNASVIHRRNRFRTITVSSELYGDATAAAVNKSIKPWLDKQAETWPLNYSYAFGGETENSKEANSAIADKLPIASLIILLLLISQFNSFRKTLILLLIVPLGIIGVIFGLLTFNSYFGFMTLLGVISLSGILINNANVLLDRIQIEINDNGLDPKEAVIEASLRRFRPILLTTGTTIGGLIPLYLGGGPMWEPMAIAMIFGLLFATTLTLGVVPVLYAMVYRLKYDKMH